MSLVDQRLQLSSQLLDELKEQFPPKTATDLMLLSVKGQHSALLAYFTQQSMIEVIDALLYPYTEESTSG